MSELNEPSELHIEEVNKAWLLTNIRGFVCPLYQVHSRAFIFHNKDMWLHHMLYEHTEQDVKFPFDIKEEFNRLKQLYTDLQDYEELEKASENHIDTLEEIEKANDLLDTVLDNKGVSIPVCANDGTELELINIDDSEKWVLWKCPQCNYEYEEHGIKVAKDIIGYHKVDKENE